MQPFLAKLDRALRAGAGLLAAAAALAAPAIASAQAVDLADRPLRISQPVPSNVLLALSVEWPTGSVQAYNDERINGCGGRVDGFSVCYFDPPQRAANANAAQAGNRNWRARASMPYLGYFDPYRCYAYDRADQWFEPQGRTIGFVEDGRPNEQQPAASKAQCGGAGWSGNFLNWATMHTIDVFRWVMTGGSRAAGLDTASITVLEKARHTGQGGTTQFPIKRIDGANGTSPSDIAPVSGSRHWSALHLAVDGLGTRIWVSNQNDFPGRGQALRSNGNSRAEEFQLRVRVCVPGVRESATTCKAYHPLLADDDPTNDAAVNPAAVSWKPIGLIQENAMAVRFSAFGYLLDDSWDRDGGVMRARMKFVGPKQPARSAIGSMANPAPEWDPDTGVFLANPDAADANATNTRYNLSGGDAVTRSGVIQYLNEFGRKAGYKEHDPVSEMYYEATRYYRNVGPVPEYSAIAANDGNRGRMVDGFPVITQWDDPLAPPAGFAGPDLQEWCPKNFIIGIADSNAHKDKRLPGNSATDNEPGAQPSVADTGIDVTALLAEIIASEQANEGVALLNSQGNALGSGIANFCCQGSAYLASLAYHANTRDLRPDAAALQTRGPQTVQTFYVDVREKDSWGTNVARSDVRRRNQMWLAAKYGGFADRKDAGSVGRLDNGDAVNDYNGDGRLDARDVWDKDSDGLPDNYFEADTPEALVEGLRSAFASIRAQAASAVGVGVSTRSADFVNGTGIFRVRYDPRNWSGNLIGYRYNGVDASGKVLTAQAWDAAQELAAQDWDTGRVIVTTRPGSNGGRAAAVPFRWNTLSAAQQRDLGSDSKVLEYLRGRNDLPGLRRRLRFDDLGRAYPAVLGDIVDSEPRFVGAPVAPYIELHNPGYGAFQTARAGRRNMVYVGANDGMLHGFDADVAVGGGTGGREVFAYVPSFLFGGVSDPAVDGLRALASPGYVHRHYVNATPAVGDVDFARAGVAPGSASATPDWRTVLVAGLGKGGRGFFALDVTDPSAFSGEAAAAAKVLWEFSDPDMGFSYGLPQIVKTPRWGWVVLLTSGYNPGRAPPRGVGGYLYVVDIRNGSLLHKVAVPTGSAPAGSIGLAQVTAFAPDATDGTITEVYGGDLNGNVWRFDFTSATAAVPAPSAPIAELRDASGRAQPVTAGPVVRAAPLSRNRYVFIGTGRLLGVSDLYTSMPQTFYALRDGTRARPWQAGQLPAPIDFPLTRAKLVHQTDLLNAIARDPARPGGWYLDLPTAGERVLLDAADTDFGKISWLGSIPDANNPCSPGGGSRIYAAGFETGQSQLFATSASGSGTGSRVRVASINPNSGAVGLRLVNSDRNVSALVTDPDQNILKGPDLFQFQNPRSLNWREVLEPGQ